MQPFPQRLAALMNEKNISQQTLGQAIGVTRQSIAQYLDDNTQPNAKKICELADYFGVSTDYLLGRVDYRSPTASVQGICEETGLSSETVEALMEMKSAQNDDREKHKEAFFELLNTLLSGDTLEELIRLSADVSALIDAEEKQKLYQDKALNQAVLKAPDCLKPFVLNPLENADYRKYLVDDRMRKIEKCILSNFHVRRTWTKEDAEAAKFYWNLIMEGGDL